ncbi:hypothetical protein SAMN04515671_2907 [Nakamurella panacisegetis]|uniref:Uncharacterized protein n=1 Tax=Nakamurella panacisegetis TaxID=1090615 RepID=A0A1H0PUN6_9ACTN|nr:hypothetical protein [Nakamurella panacisegetis]SDP08724.1 hypothetical protein SAMN04515671_2907 [Nakamurella panacisegetis]
MTTPKPTPAERVAVLIEKARELLVAAKAIAAFLIPLLGSAAALVAGSRAASIMLGAVAVLSAIAVYSIPNAEADPPGKHEAKE